MMYELIEAVKLLGPFGFSIVISIYLLVRTTRVLEHISKTLALIQEKIDNIRTIKIENIDDLKSNIKYLNYLIERLGDINEKSVD